MVEFPKEVPVLGMGERQLSASVGTGLFLSTLRYFLQVALLHQKACFNGNTKQGSKGEGIHL